MDLLLVAGIAGVGCGLNAAFVCDTPDDCRDGAIAGLCEADGYCSFPDHDCESGRRYGERAPAGIANDCAPEDPSSDDTGSEGPSSGAPEPVSETTPTSDGDGDTGDADAGTSAPDPDHVPATRIGESTGGDASSDGEGDDDDEGAQGSEEGESSSSSSSGGGEPVDCNSLGDCASCLDCAGTLDGPCGDEVDACADANGCMTGVTCWESCLLTGECFDPCCGGDADAQIDELVLCRADHCLDACSEYEFLTCG